MILIYVLFKELFKNLEKLSQESKELKEKSSKEIDDLFKRNAELVGFNESLKKDKDALTENHQRLEKSYKTLHNEIK